MHDKTVDKLLQGLNILIVDNNRYMRRLTRTMLMNLGAKSVIEAADGLAALEQIRTCDPDVMFLDWDMPVLDGMEVIRTGRISAPQSADHHADQPRPSLVGGGGLARRRA